MTELKLYIGKLFEFFDVIEDALFNIFRAIPICFNDKRESWIFGIY